jgi:hypothetical protein
VKKMLRKITLVTVVILCLSGYICFAANTQNISVTASIPQVTNGLDIGISKITPGASCTAPDTWTPNQSSIAFGALTWDTTYKIFKAAQYYAVDIGVINNGGTNWTLTHTRTNLQKDTTNNLNNNVNVTFMKQLSSATGTELQKVTYGESNNVAYTKSQLVGTEGGVTKQGWLRIYYGIATGDQDPTNGCPDDAANAVPIGTDKPYGTYTGAVTITLSGV